MADMHPLRRAQLELETAEQAARGPPMQNTAAELDVEVFSMRAAATGAKSVGMQLELPTANNTTPSMRFVPRNPRAMQTPNVTNIATKVPTLTKRVKNERKERMALLRTQINEADQAGNYAHAQYCYDELATTKAICNAENTARLNDPRRLARRAKKRAARAKRRDTAIGNGTYVTQKRAKKEERKSIDRALARYATCPKQQSDRNDLYHYQRFEERQQSAKYVARQEPQSSNYAVNKEEQGDMHTSYRSPDQQPFHSRYDDFEAEQFSWYDYYIAQQDARCEYHQQQLLARYEGSPSSASRKWERINVDDSSFDETTSDDDGSNIVMGGVALPVTASVRGEATSQCRSFSPTSKVGDGQLVDENFGNVANQVHYIHRPNTWGARMPEDTSAGERRQKSQNMHGDGSKQFLDPDSTAYKMMSRMGWSQGRGLGKEGVGVPEYVEVSVKTDKMGLQTRATASPVREVHQPVFNYMAPLRRSSRSIPVLDPTRQIGKNFPDKRHTIIDLTQDDTDDHDMKAGPAFIDLTQDIVVDLTQDNDGGDANDNRNGPLPMDVTPPVNHNPEQYGMTDTTQQTTGSKSPATMLTIVAPSNFEESVGAIEDEQMDNVDNVARIGNPYEQG